MIALCGNGGYAEYVAVPEALTFPIPDGVDDGTALALLVQGLTAWHLYKTCARVAPGESVVVIAAAGGVGSLAVQLGQQLGAGRVIAVASTEEKRALTLELGADAAIDAAPEGMTERIVEANGGRPVDAVFEMAGGAVFDACLDALAPFGRLVTYGIASREQNEVRTGALMRKSRAVVGFWFMHCMGRRDMVEEPLADLFGARRARRAESRRRRDATRSPRPPAPRSTSPSAARPASCCSTRAPELAVRARWPHCTAWGACEAGASPAQGASRCLRPFASSSSRRQSPWPRCSSSASAPVARAPTAATTRS